MASVYEKVLGDNFKQLPPGLAMFHSLAGVYNFKGHAKVVGASNVAARIIAKILGLPTRSREVEVNFILTADSNVESWVREFSEQTMHSTLCAESGFIIERLGPVILRSTLTLRGESLQMRITEVTIAGMKVPGWCLPNVIADERSSENKLIFHIEVRWLWLGTLVGYSGFLDLSSRTRLA